jgi:hypothetical protein
MMNRVTGGRLLIALFALAGVVGTLRAADPVLRFPDGLSWKDVFDSGFRPKHLGGLERTTCVCQDQRFTLEMSGTGKGFLLDTGRLSFRLLSDDSVGVFWHSGWTPISLEEGERRLQAFREWVGEENLKEKGQVPPVIDPNSGIVNAETEYHAKARIGQFAVTYGFAASFRKEAPLMPHLHMALIPLPGKSTPPARRKIVEPPAGYEWYSLDPKIDTPEPGIRRPMTNPPRSAETVMAAADAVSREKKAHAVKASLAATGKAAWPFVLALLLAVLLGLVLWRRHCKRAV